MFYHSSVLFVCNPLTAGYFASVVHPIHHSFDQHWMRPYRPATDFRLQPTSVIFQQFRALLQVGRNTLLFGPQPEGTLQVSTDKTMVKTREKGSLLTHNSSHYDKQTNHEIVKHTAPLEPNSPKQQAGLTCSMPSPRQLRPTAWKLAALRTDPNNCE